MAHLSLLFIENQHLQAFSWISSFLPVIYKKSLIYTILFRYLNICSSYSIFHEELAKFKSLLLQNGYPQRLIDNCICSFLNKVSDTPIKPLTAPKLQLSIVLPFTGSHGFKIRQQLLKLISSAHLHIDFRVIFRPVCRLSHFFWFKDRITMRLRSNIVYKFTCQCCSALYFCKTTRNLHTRICEHMGISAYTGKEISHPPSLSCILAHKRETGHPISFDDCSILASGRSELDTLIRESLLIAKNKSLSQCKH